MLDTGFGAAEVIEMAKDIEKKGRNFYETEAAATDNKELKDLLLKLAEDEKDHYRRFEELGKEFELDTNENAYVYDEEVSAYLKALVEFEVFPAEDDLEKEADEMSVEDILLIAIGAEKDSILFYQEMLENNEGKTADVVRQLIAEEKEHLLELVRIDANLK